MTKEQIKIELKLTRPAKGRGGDRYEGVYTEDAMALYFPQSVSRPEGVAKAELTLTIE